MLNEEMFLKILDTIGFLIALVVVCVLMLVLVVSDIYFFIIFGIFFVYTVFQMVDFLKCLISYSKKRRIIKYPFRTIRS